MPDYLCLRQTNYSYNPKRGSGNVHAWFLLLHSSQILRLIDGCHSDGLYDLYASLYACNHDSFLTYKEIYIKNETVLKYEAPGLCPDACL